MHSIVCIRTKLGLKSCGGEQKKEEQKRGRNKKGGEGSPAFLSLQKQEGITRATRQEGKKRKGRRGGGERKRGEGKTPQLGNEAVRVTQAGIAEFLES